MLEGGESVIFFKLASRHDFWDPSFIYKSLTTFVGRAVRKGWILSGEKGILALGL